MKCVANRVGAPTSMRACAVVNRECDGREEAVEWSEVSGLRMCKRGRWAWWARSQSAVHLLMFEP